jgi:predicted NAD/FAD-dependent oxidoreductase
MVTGNFLEEAKTSEVFENLLQVRFFPSFSLGLFYDQKTVLGLGWKWKYFPDSPLVRFVAVDSLKRGDARAPTSICVQSQRSWARDHVELSKEEALPLLLAEVNRLLPALPRPDSLHSHKWRFSQIRTPYPGESIVLQMRTSCC